MFSKQTPVYMHTLKNGQTLLKCITKSQLMTDVNGNCLAR